MNRAGASRGALPRGARREGDRRRDRRLFASFSRPFEREGAPLFKRENLKPDETARTAPGGRRRARPGASARPRAERRLAGFREAGHQKHRRLGAGLALCVCVCVCVRARASAFRRANHAPEGIARAPTRLRGLDFPRSARRRRRLFSVQRVGAREAVEARRSLTAARGQQVAPPPVQRPFGGACPDSPRVVFRPGGVDACRRAGGGGGGPAPPRI